MKIKLSIITPVITLIWLMLNTMFLAGSVHASTYFLAITESQTLDIHYNVVQLQPGIKITHVRIGNDVTDEYENWSEWMEITDANGELIPGGLLVGTATIKDWSLPTGKENDVTNVCIQLRDESWTQTLWSSKCSPVFWDTNPPEEQSIILNEYSPWDNDWEFPIYVHLTDDVGINSSTGISISENEGPYVSLPGASCTYNLEYAKYVCILSTTYKANPTRSTSTFRLRYCDNLNNCEFSEIIEISFSATNSQGSVSISQETQASNLVNVNYNVYDGDSGIQHITIENVTTNPGNVNKETIFLSDGIWPSSLSGTKKGYALTERSGIVKLTIVNRAGTTTEIYSNAVSANRIGFESIYINKVINPLVYTTSNPFIPVLVNANMPMDNPPEAVAGGNISVTHNFYWDPSVTEVSGFYQFKIENSSGYVQYETKPFDISDITINGNNALLILETTVDKMAPISNEDDITYVSLQLEMYATLSGIPEKFPLYFPARNDYYVIAKITGSIDDAINFQGRN